MGDVVYHLPSHPVSRLARVLYLGRAQTRRSSYDATEDMEISSIRDCNVSIVFRMV
jgi:hypothetical protein